MVSEIVITLYDLVKVRTITETYVEFRDGSKIEFYDSGQDCYSDNYADFTSLKDTGFEDNLYQMIIIERVELGVKINGYFVPCYSMQNGYYSTMIDIIYKDENGNVFGRVRTYAEVVD
jgi:hypothetical protein